MSKIFFNLSVLCLLFSCATAREVSVKPGKGGVVAVIPKGNPEARQKALDLMAANCGSMGKPVITEEGESVVGETGRSDGNAYSVSKNFTMGSSTTQKHNETEWRITYECKP